MGILKWLGSLVVFTILVGVISMAFRELFKLLGFFSGGISTFSLILALVVGVLVVLKINGMIGTRK